MPIIKILNDRLLEKCTRNIYLSFSFLAVLVHKKHKKIPVFHDIPSECASSKYMFHIICKIDYIPSIMAIIHEKQSRNGRIVAPERDHISWGSSIFSVWCCRQCGHHPWQLPGAADSRRHAGTGGCGGGMLHLPQTPATPFQLHWSVTIFITHLHKLANK